MNTVLHEGKTELFIGLVGATGSNLKPVQSHIQDILSQFNYRVESLKFSDFLEDPDFLECHNLNSDPDFKVDKSNRFSEIKSQIKLGTQTRKIRETLLSEYAIIKLRNKREGR